MNKPFAITLDVGSSLANKTGSWRTERPVYRDLLPPCNHACPAGENIQAWLYEAEEGGEGYERAWRKLMEDNPFPAIMGRVCYHPCETACNRAELDSAVGINSVERFLGDEAITQRLDGDGRRGRVRKAGARRRCRALRSLGRLPPRPPRPRRHRAGRRGAPGGMMRYGIPRYRLPREILDAEVSRILSLGVTLELGVKVDDVLGAMHGEGFDAVFLAVGAHIGKRAYVPAGEAARILDAVTVLHSMEGEEQPLLGRRVAVYGGGNTAMDVARTARRLGATEAVVVYRRTRDRMPAHDFEVEEAEEEGVRMKWLSTVKRAEAASSRSSGWSSTRPASRSRPASSRSSRPTRSCSRSARSPTSRCSTTCPDRGRRRRRAGRGGHDDRPPGDLRRRRHGARRADGDGRHRARQEGRPQHRRVAARRRARASRRSTSSPSSSALNTWYYADAPRTVRPKLELARRAVDVRRGRRRPRRDDRALRGAPLPLVRQLLRAATTASASAPTTR